VKDIYSREQLEILGLWRVLQKQKEEVACRMEKTEEDLAEEDFKRLKKKNRKVFEPVFSVTAFSQEYWQYARSRLLPRFGARRPDDQEDRWQDICARALDTKHLRRYVTILAEFVSLHPPEKLEGETQKAFQTRLARYQKYPPDVRGKWKVSRPKFQTHIWTITQSCCVNMGNRERRNPSVGALSFSLGEEDGERSLFIDSLGTAQTSSPPTSDISLELRELFDMFGDYLRSKYCTRRSISGKLVDHWGPDLKATRIKLHPPDITSDKLVFDEKGRLVSCVAGTPVFSETGEMVSEYTGETIRRSYRQVWDFLRQGFSQAEIAVMLEVSPGSPGNWVSQLRKDWIDFISDRKLTEQELYAHV
jgi:hypothetical protein